MIYIYKNNQQSGPFEERIVLDQLNAGLLSPDDMAIRHGESKWQTLGAMFPDSAVMPAMQTSQPVQFAAVTENPAESQYRNTLVF